MLEKIMTVGPKGQIVIPKSLRDEYGITPKDKVVLKEGKEGIIVAKPSLDVVSIFRKIAKSGRKVKRIDIQYIRNELEGKWARASEHK